ncbi:FecR family protein [Rhizosphaericola mali]|uniref:FecR family protein n=1 Tax=Rhizosphaericola mali TaxID=2545455 RepID=A0A5P2G564_9BACT|nr:FecR family protein [Rhizosphaericola mali]QES89828.1 FecR family protein [Rhizosphaericola mali]
MSLENDWEEINEGGQLSEQDYNHIFKDIKGTITRQRRNKNVTIYTLSTVFVSVVCFFLYAYLKSVDQQDKIALYVFENKTRNPKVYHLVDGSTMILDKGAKAFFANNYNENYRKIYLQGSGAFTVAKKEGVPFIVYTNHFSTQAIGTAFKIKNDLNANYESALLTEGIVQIQVFNALKKRILAIGDSLVYKRVNKDIVIHNTNKILYSPKNIVKHSAAYNSSASQNVAWIKPQWYAFENAALPDLFKRLEKIYQVHIDIDSDGMKDKYFIGRFSATDSLTHILKVITSLNNLEVKQIDSKTFHIYRKP